MKDIARELGVATSTVSRALARHPGIPAETRERVVAMATQLGYRPDPVMSSMAAKRWARAGAEAGAGLAFVFLGSAVQQTSEHLRGARLGAAAMGYRLEVYAVNDAVSARRVERVLRARGIRGVVLRYARPNGHLPDWAWEDFAVVVCGEPPREATRMDQVELAITDNHQRIARECLARGLRRPGLLFAGPEWLRSEHRRLGGLTTPFLEAGETAPPFRWWDGRNVAELRGWLIEQKVDSVITMVGSQAERLRAERVVGPRRLPYACMQVLPRDPPELAGIRSDFATVGERAARLCDMSIRQGRFGLPELPTVTHVPSRWQAGVSLDG